MEGITVALGDDPLAPGSRIGPYLLGGRLGEGGMGVVLKAEHAVLMRAVALKVMRPEIAADRACLDRFLREARAAAAVNHQNLVAIHDAGEVDGRTFLAFEFVPGGDLDAVLARDGALAPARALELIAGCADGLQALHEAGLVHRDIKPHNIFLDRHGRPKLGDFGLARDAGGADRLTMTGVGMGTPAYMAPEQANGDPGIDVRADIHALGGTLYTLLTRRIPFTGATPWAVVNAVVNDPVPDPRAVRPDLPAEVAAIVARAMAKRREERFQTPSELRVALADALAALGTGGAAVMPAAPAQTLDRTITCDLLAEDKPGSTSDSHPTVKVGPDGEVDAGATMAVAAGDWAGAPAGVMTSVVQTPAPKAAPVVPAERIDGDLTRGLEAPWIALVGDGCHVLLYARRQITLGKLCEAPVDVCLRKHPTTMFRDDCLRISRQHLQLRFDAPTNRLLLGDLGSGNGTLLDGAAMGPNAPQAIEAGGERRLHVAGALTLNLRAHARKGEPPASLGNDAGSVGDCGLDQSFAFDSAVLSRPDNRPGMAYALVLRRLSIGGPGSDLVLPQASGAAAELALWRGRWIWRPGPGAWQPLSDGLVVSAGNKRLKARVGGYDIFQTEG
ncbi:MAG TPA: hypothetical protein DCS97_15155 [Planctomycetes bacterium]|nr:hypothetical protein [Planctomycetota bacterium]